MEIFFPTRFAIAVCFCAAAIAQESAADSQAPAAKPPADTPQDKRVFGVLPNYRGANLSDKFVPLTARQKMRIGFKDSTDYPVFLTAIGFAGLYQLENSHPSFGQGMAGFGKRYGTAIADQSIGNILTESLMPIAFHEDPRYFRLGTGSVGRRIGYAASRIFVTYTDSGHKRFNFSEVIGNAAAAGIANAYYKDERGFNDNFQRLYTSLATDAVSQILKEFWPDIKRKYFKKKTQP